VTFAIKNAVIKDVVHYLSIEYHIYGGMLAYAQNYWVSGLHFSAGRCMRSHGLAVVIFMTMTILRASLNLHSVFHDIGCYECTVSKHSKAPA
jgi:hypothetical protein